MIKETLYPITFKPILKRIIWGGDDISPFKGINPGQTGIGESWELSHVEGNYSVVDNGTLEGWSIEDLVNAYGKQLVGEKVMEKFGHTFPLLIKFIDARDNLSIQVHPNDELAKKRHNSFGKTEMWYVIKAAEGAALYSGFSRQIDAAEYVKRVEDDSIMEVLQYYEVKPGDVFFLPSGRIHAIGSGCFIAEIQQTSDITYRIYDYNRKDANGQGRELHTELAKDVFDYTVSPDYRTRYMRQKNSVVPLENCPYFTTNLLDLDTTLVRDFHLLDSFVVYICLAGSFTLSDNKGNTISLHQGQTVLVPADTTQVKLEASPEVKILETYI
jgi:mannose-6-phosphate isomerase